MQSKRVAWLLEDEKVNISKYDLDFTLAKQIIINNMSITVSNIHGDNSYIGLTDDMKEVLYVYCIDEDGFSRIVMARRASTLEQNAFFDLISGANNEEN
jgi:hypothetical protein